MLWENLYMAFMHSNALVALYTVSAHLNPLRMGLAAVACIQSELERIYIHLAKSVNAFTIPQRVWTHLQSLGARLNTFTIPQRLFEGRIWNPSAHVWTHLYALSARREADLYALSAFERHICTLTFSSLPPVHVFVVEVVWPIAEHQPEGPCSKLTET